MSDRAQHVIDAIDGALADDEFPDAMRWSPEPAAVEGAPAPFDGQTVWQPPQSYEVFDAGHGVWQTSAWSDPATSDPVGDIRRAAELMHSRPAGGQLPDVVIMDDPLEVLPERMPSACGLLSYVIVDEPAFASGVAVNARCTLEPVFTPAGMREARAFARRWAAGSGMTIAEIGARIPDWEVHRCPCGADDCTGWAMRPPGFGFERPGPSGVPLREIAAAEQLEAALRPAIQAAAEVF